MKIIAMFFALALVSGCSGVDLIDQAAEGFTDRMIAKAESFNDKILDRLDAAEDLLKRKQDRLRLVKCKFPVSALLRYAHRSSEHAARVATDCGLFVNGIQGFMTPRLDPKPSAQES